MNDEHTIPDALHLSQPEPFHSSLSTVENVVDKRIAAIKRYDAMQDKIADTSVEYLRDKKNNVVLEPSVLSAVANAISKSRNDIIPKDVPPTIINNIDIGGDNRSLEDLQRG